MNKENILRLADYIEGPGGDGFNIANYDTCICGKKNEMLDREEHQTLVDFLGLDEDEVKEHEKGQFFQLTSPKDYKTDTARYPREQAVRTLRHFAETGEVDWEIGK